MDDNELKNEIRARRRNFNVGLALTGVGGVLTGIGFLVGSGRTGDEATVWGIMAGAGAALLVAGMFIAWLSRSGAKEWRDGETTKRDRLQAQRAWQLWLFPLVTFALLAQSILAMRDIMAGEGGFADYMGAALPVIYAWVVASITMGWDHQTRNNRRLMEDELTMLIRARAIGAAFIVLMAGATVAFGLGLWRLEIGVASLPLVLALAGATAGIRFAWLDREYSRDG